MGVIMGKYNPENSQKYHIPNSSSLKASPMHSRRNSKFKPGGLNLKVFTIEEENNSGIKNGSIPEKPGQESSHSNSSDSKKAPENSKSVNSSIDLEDPYSHLSAKTYKNRHPDFSIKSKMDQQSLRIRKSLRGSLKLKKSPVNISNSASGSVASPNPEKINPKFKNDDLMMENVYDEESYDKFYQSLGDELFKRGQQNIKGKLDKYEGLTRLNKAKFRGEISTNISHQSQKIISILGTYSEKLLASVKKTAAFVYHNTQSLNKDTQKILAVPLLDLNETAKYKRKKKILGTADITSKKLDLIEDEYKLRPDGTISYQISRVPSAEKLNF